MSWVKACQYRPLGRAEPASMTLENFKRHQSEEESAEF
jgi:hypothetical protein